jgi:hypothetical protein
MLLTVLRVLCASVVKFLRFEIDFHFQVGPAPIL